MFLIDVHSYSLHILIYAFVGAIPDHWCTLPEVEGYTSLDLKNLTIPKYEINTMNHATCNNNYCKILISLFA